MFVKVIDTSLSFPSQVYQHMAGREVVRIHPLLRGASWGCVGFRYARFGVYDYTIGNLAYLVLLLAGRPTLSCNFIIEKQSHFFEFYTPIFIFIRS